MRVSSVCVSVASWKVRSESAYVSSMRLEVMREMSSVESAEMASWVVSRTWMRVRVRGGVRVRNDVRR